MGASAIKVISLPSYAVLVEWPTPVPPTKWAEKEMSVMLGSYAVDGSLALILCDKETGARQLTASVWLNGSPPLGKDRVWIKNWSENEGVFESLQAAGVITPTGFTIKTGFCIAHEAQLTEAFIEALPKEFKAYVTQG